MASCLSELGSHTTEIDTYKPHELDIVDDVTASLILQLQAEDIEALLVSSKGKGRDGEVSDADLAVALYQKEVQDTNTVRADHSMARSLAHAVISDAAVLSELLAEENAAAVDRALAHRFAGVKAPSTVPLGQATTESALDYGFLTRLAALYVSGTVEEPDNLDNVTDNENSIRAESSDWAASRQTAPNSLHRECIACYRTKPLFESLQTPCGHNYCQECIRTLFQLSTADETLFPPRCCHQEIPLQVVKLYLSRDLIHTFEVKSIEFRTSIALAVQSFVIYAASVGKLVLANSGTKIDSLHERIRSSLGIDPEPEQLEGNKSTKPWLIFENATTVDTKTGILFMGATSAKSAINIFRGTFSSADNVELWLVIDAG